MTSGAQRCKWNLLFRTDATSRVSCLEERGGLSGIIWHHADGIFRLPTQHTQHSVFLKDEWKCEVNEFEISSFIIPVSPVTISTPRHCWILESEAARTVASGGTCSVAGLYSCIHNTYSNSSYAGTWMACVCLTLTEGVSSVKAL